VCDQPQRSRTRTACQGDRWWLLSRCEHRHHDKRLQGLEKGQISLCYRWHGHMPSADNTHRDLRISGGLIAPKMHVSLATPLPVEHNIPWWYGLSSGSTWLCRSRIRRGVRGFSFPMVVHKADVWEGSTAKSVSESWTGSNEVRQRSLAFYGC
jgi:hypothetical protein